MAVQQISVMERGIHVYAGLSGDTKPSATAVPVGSRFIETDTGSTFLSSLAGWSNVPMAVWLDMAFPGARNDSSLTNSYLVTRDEANLSIISTTSAVTIGGGAANDTHLMSVLIHTALTGTLAITGFADTAGTAQTWTIPAGFVGSLDFKGAINSAGAITMTASNAGDDNKIAVLWRPV